MRFRTRAALICAFTAAATWSGLVASPALARTEKPPLHGQHWMAITGKPLAATAGAMMFQKGGNAIDATCAMLAAVSTMWDVLSWGGETQALIYDPRAKKVVAINGLGVAPSGATAEFYRGKGYKYPPEHGPRAPSFARATVARDGERRFTFISGTSAIKGHQTVAPGALEAQLDCTLDNLRLISRASGLGDDLAGSRDARRHFKVYLRQPRDLAITRARLERTLLQGSDTVSYLHAEICRRSLHVEIEATVIE